MQKFQTKKHLLNEECQSHFSFLSHLALPLVQFFKRRLGSHFGGWDIQGIALVYSDT